MINRPLHKLRWLSKHHKNKRQLHCNLARLIGKILGWYHHSPEPVNDLLKVVELGSPPQGDSHEKPVKVQRRMRFYCRAHASAHNSETLINEMSSRAPETWSSDFLCLGLVSWKAPKKMEKNRASGFAWMVVERSSLLPSTAEKNVAIAVQFDFVA